MERFESVDAYIEHHEFWASKLNELREILLSTELIETVKWGAPAYTLDGKILVGLGAFKNFLSIWFHQGVFLSDENQVLINAQKGVTKALRQWRINKDDNINKPLILKYILEAIENHKNGVELEVQRKKTIEIPSILNEQFENNSSLYAAFKKFTPFKQREFCEHISDARKEATQLRRLEKIIAMIEQGVGLNDKYRK